MSKPSLKALLLILLAVGLVFLVFKPFRPTERERQRAVFEREGSVADDLRQIDMAKLLWADEHGATGSVAVSARDIAPYLAGNLPLPRDGLLPLKTASRAKFKVNALGIPPEAELTRASTEGPKGTVVRLTAGHPDTEILLPNKTD